MAKETHGNVDWRQLKAASRQGDGETGLSFGGGDATEGHVLVFDANGSAVDSGQAFTDTFGITINDTTTGSKGFIQLGYGGVIDSWTILADDDGRIQIDVKKSTYGDFPTTASIVGGNPPTLGTFSPLTNAQKATDDELSGWTVAFTAGDVFEFVVDAVGGNSVRFHLMIHTTRM